MGGRLDKFLLLMWKNWRLQYRKPIQTLIEIISPILLSIMLVWFRSLEYPQLRDPIIFPPFCTIRKTNDELVNSLCQNYETNDMAMFSKAIRLNRVRSKREDEDHEDHEYDEYDEDDEDDEGEVQVNFAYYELLYSPRSNGLDAVMDFFHILFHRVVKFDDSKALNDYIVHKRDIDNTYGAIQFDDRYQDVNDISQINDLKVIMRYKAMTRIGRDWKTNNIYPRFQTPGPREYHRLKGAAPIYYEEGFLAIQHFLTLSFILARKDFTLFHYQTMYLWLQDNPPPLIHMRRFPHASWYEDRLLNDMKIAVGLTIMLSFLYTCINMVKSLTTEKEKQLKEAMKIMGLPNWLHWTAWFIKAFICLIFSVVLILVLLKVKWYTDFTIFTYADANVMLLFLVLYICATITFCFALSVFFSKANTAATVAGIVWFLSFVPYLCVQANDFTLSLTSKLIASLGSNTAMGFGFQVLIMYEGTGEGIQWNTLFKPNTIDENLSLGLIMMMLAIDSILYLIITLYLEAVFPGEYGVAKPWYFLFTTSFWCSQYRYEGVEGPNTTMPANQGEYFESEPNDLPAGIQIKNLRKVFGRKAAVRNLSLNMYEGQITVLLGHNGAGKTTTMSMLTGLLTPSSGTAKVNGYDIRTNMDAVRGSLGLCPQHNIIFDELTVAEHLYFFSKLKGLSTSETKTEIDKYVNLLELEPKRNAKSSTLSGGMKRKLCVGIALCGNSKIVMLDEPTAGMDPSARRTLWDLLQSQKEERPSAEAISSNKVDYFYFILWQDLYNKFHAYSMKMLFNEDKALTGRTMLLSTHFMDEADLLGDRIAIMAGGVLQCCGSSFFLKKKYGIGYSLIIDKSKNCDVNQVTQLLRKYIPNIEIHGNIGSELTYLLGEKQSSVFEPMLQELEKKSKELGILSYGISLTTLEEVFMLAGADHGQEEMYSESPDQHNIHENMTNNEIEQNGDAEMSSLRPSCTGGWSLLKNQFVAMVMKKFLSNLRSWVLLLVHITMPVLFLVVAIVVTRLKQEIGNLPAMPLTLDKFEDPITLVQNIDDTEYFDAYKKVIDDFKHDIEVTTDITDTMMHLTSTIPSTVRTRYIVGASFDTGPMFETIGPHITAWFNNDAYHSPAISLGLVLNTMLRKMLNCDDCKIEFTNYPMPFNSNTQLSRLRSGENMGYEIAFYIAFSMAFVSSFYVLFIVKENTSKSKHLQLVSGVKVYIFWFTSLFCDMITYVVTLVPLLITLKCFKEDGFSTTSDIGRVLLILLCFAWEFMPLLYLSGLFFDVPATGYTRMTLFSISTGIAAFMIVQMLINSGADFESTADTLHWTFLTMPHYSLASGIMESYKMFMSDKICSMCLNGTCFYDYDEYNSSCSGIDGNYFRWEAPGIGRNLIFSSTIGTILFVLLLSIEYELCAKAMYYIKKIFTPGRPIDDENEDSDVRDEKQRIRNVSEQELKNQYILVLRDLTKYYGRYLAVNSLCLGVNSYECFGLLGINGAGKTTTFKMMTGDVKVSYGDGWVNGFSIKKQIKQVQKSVGYCPQFDALLDDMTAKETMVMFGLLRGIRYADCSIMANNLARDFDFRRHLHKKVKALSGGNKRKLSTAISLIGDPPVIYLDEPTAGMDPATRRYLWNAICRIRDDGKCVVMTSHSMEECEALCTKLAIMVNGTFKCLGSTQHLKNKFAEGYTLLIQIKRRYDQSDVERIEQFIRQNFPSAKLKEKHRGLLNYYITDKSIPCSKMFGILEKGKKSNLNIEDYSLGQSSLEQVFLSFTGEQ